MTGNVEKTENVEMTGNIEMTGNVEITGIVVQLHTGRLVSFTLPCSQGRSLRLKITYPNQAQAVPRPTGYSKAHRI